MKINGILLIFILFFNSYAASAQLNEKQLLAEMRENLPKAFYDEKICTELLEKCKSTEYSDPILNGYIGGLYIARSKHAPLTKKISALKTGTTKLETAIKERANNIELLFLRLTIQLNLPGFLGYNDNIEDDKKFVLNNFNSASPILKNRIIDFVKTSGHFSETDKAIILNNP